MKDTMKTMTVIAVMFVAIITLIAATAFAFLAIQPTSNLLAVVVLLAGSLVSLVIPMLAAAKTEELID